LSNQPLLLYVLGIISALGVVAILMVINTMVLLLVTRRDARSIRWREAAVPLMIGLVLAIVEIAVVSYLRYNLTGTMTGFPGI
jgi:Mg/Co/Ni transporter MgtE